MKPYILISILLSFSLGSAAQSNLWDASNKARQQAGKKVAEKQKTIKSWKDHLQKWGLDSSYNHALAVGGRLNGNGWSGLVYYERRINRWQSHFFQLSFSEIKHEKQAKQQPHNDAFPGLGNGSPYVFGKINNLYTLQLGHGRDFLLLPGLLEGNMSISLRMEAGVALAMLKPYYLQLAYDSVGGQPAYMQEQKYNDQDADKFLNTGYILGASKWGKGLGEMQYIPGGFADVAIAIEPLKNKTFIKTITLGGNFAFYSKDLPVMATQKAYPWTATVFVGLTMGKRWK
ncbi:hypothetical protein ACTHGU_04740 [Chitinophagaceae bacterium MMS25-I14]